MGRSAIGVVGLALVCATVGCGLAKKARVAESSAASPSRAPGEPPAASNAGWMLPNTILLSAMLRELSGHPGFTEQFLAEVQSDTTPNGHKKAGAARLTPDLVHHLRDMILGRNWEGLDRFPGWTMREINPTVRVAGHIAGKDQKVDSLATAGGAPSGKPGEGTSRKAALALIDLGGYGLERGGTVNLDQPASTPGFDAREYVAELGDGVTRGDGPDPRRAPHHAASQQLADMLNRLSLNGWNGAAGLQAEFGGRTATTPQDLIAAIQASGHQVMVADSRYFANFGHLHYNGQDVMMPFWVNAQIVIPGTKRPLLVPVSHAEYEWFITGPKMNAEVSFYFGIDGKAEFRTMDQLDQAWVMNRHAHEYRGSETVEVTRLAGRMVQAYTHEHEARPKLPFGGYYALGVCQDVVAAIELKLTGKTTLFPNTADAALFNDPRDAEINALIRGIPKDRAGRPPEVARIFGSLPTGDSDAELTKISIPGLGPDLIAVHDAWTVGDLRRIRPRWEVWARRGAAVLGILLGCGVAWWVRERSHR
jgi:hypothetical protein